MNEIDCKMNDCWWQCGDENKHNECYCCTQNINADDKMKNCYIDVSGKLNELYDYLTGTELPDGVTCTIPKLSGDEALSVIWFLQEITCCVPDYIEQCQKCLILYNSECEGYHLDDQYAHRSNGRTIAEKYWGFYCDNCVPNIDFILK